MGDNEMVAGKGLLIVNLDGRITDLEHNGGRFCQVTRERTDGLGRRVDEAEKRLCENLEAIRENTRWVMWLSCGVILFAFISGGSLVVNLVKFFFKIP